MKKWIFIFCCITFYSCYIEESKSLRRSELYKDFIDMTKKAKNHTEMNDDGLFFSKVEHYDVEGTLVINNWNSPLLFKKNGYVYSFVTYAYSHSSTYFNMILNRELFNFRWGVYEINGNMITAIIPTEYYKRGLMIDYKLSKYEGVLISPDSITNWRMVPPFPTNIDKELNKDVLKYYQKPLSYSFYKNNIALKEACTTLGFLSEEKFEEVFHPELLV